MVGCPKSSPQGTGLVSDDCGRTFSPAVKHSEIELIEHLAQNGPVDILGHYVCHVFSAQNLNQGDSSGAYLPWHHKSDTSKCLILPMPRRLHIPIAAVASECARILYLNPRSRATDCMPSPCAIPEAMPPSSASPEDKAMVDCVFDHAFTNDPFMRQIPPAVDRRVSLQPAKSVSTKISRLSSSVTPLPHWSWCTSRGFPAR